MTIDTETMLERGNFQIPVFAEFLKTILSGTNRSLMFRAFRRVPPECFTGLEEEIVSCMSDPQAPGLLAVQAEMMRGYSGREEDKDFLPGAVKIMNSAFFGRPMSIAEGLSIYKEKIRKEPRLTDHYIGLAKKTGKKVAMIRESECLAGKASLKKIGPNEPCPCGSGKKYKKCCKRKH